MGSAEEELYTTHLCHLFFFTIDLLNSDTSLKPTSGQEGSFRQNEIVTRTAMNILIVYGQVCAKKIFYCNFILENCILVWPTLLVAVLNFSHNYEFLTICAFIVLVLKNGCSVRLLPCLT